MDQKVTPKKNPYKDHEKLAARIREVQETRSIDPSTTTLPLPREGEFMVHITLLQGRSVHLKFDQQPPAGSIPVPAGKGHWPGNLIFIDPTGGMWIVPNVWYNRTWRCRVEELELALDRYQTRTRDAEKRCVGCRRSPDVRGSRIAGCETHSFRYDANRTRVPGSLSDWRTSESTPIWTSAQRHLRFQEGLTDNDETHSFDFPDAG